MTSPSDTYISCPFCLEENFDLIGLKHHLFKHCDKFESIPSLKEVSHDRYVAVSPDTYDLLVKKGIIK